MKKTPEFFVLPIDFLPAEIEHGYGNCYVALPKGHKYFGIDYNAIPVDVHGGLTFSHLGNELGNKYPERFRNKNFWIVGFDTCHYGDNLLTCDAGYCYKEAESLAKQLSYCPQCFDSGLIQTSVDDYKDCPNGCERTV